MTTINDRRSPILILLGILVLATAGCGYHLMKTEARTVLIGRIINESLQPQVETRITESLNDLLLAHPVFSPAATSGSADITLSGAIRKFERSPLFFSTGDPPAVTMARYRVAIALSLRERNGTVTDVTVNEEFSINLTGGFDEEKMVAGISDLAAKKILFLLTERYDEKK